MAGTDPRRENPAGIIAGMTGVYLEFEIISTTNQFFGTIRNIALESGYVSELDLSELHQLLCEENSLSAIERASRAAGLLQKARNELTVIDRQLDPSKFRRVFERIGAPGIHSLELVIQFYISKTERDKEDRDKLDLLATRWGSFTVQGTQRVPVLRPVKDLENKLMDLYSGLGYYIEPHKEEESILAKLSQFSEEIGSITNFREIIEKQLVRRLREYKTELGDLFYRPRVLAHILEVNIAIHNLFQQLYDAEQARLHIYLEEAKKSALSDEQTRQLAQYQPVFKMMNRAAQMDHLIDDIKQAIATQQVIDQAFIDEMERAGRKMRDLTDLLVNTLQSSRQVGEDLHKSLSSIQRLEKISFFVSATEKQILENIAQSLGKSPAEFTSIIFENAIIAIAEAVKDKRLAHAFVSQPERLKAAISALITAGYAKADTSTTNND
ncbi:MAG: hypothetical protein AB1489_17370 [Acidobacteriota bacterium]